MDKKEREKEEMSKPAGYKLGNNMGVLADEEMVEARSRKKHPDEPWEEMKFSHCFKKAIGHFLKWWWAGRGNYNDRSGPHHLSKVRWYCKKIILMEEDAAMSKRNDDRPVYKTKMAVQFVLNIFKSFSPQPAKPVEKGEKGA